MSTRRSVKSGQKRCYVDDLVQTGDDAAHLIALSRSVRKRLAELTWPKGMSSVTERMDRTKSQNIMCGVYPVERLA